MFPSLDNPCIVQLSAATNGTYKVKSKELKDTHHIETKELHSDNDIEEGGSNYTSVELPVVNGTSDVKTKELYSDVKSFDVDFKRFYGIEATRVDRRFVATLSDLTYLPKVHSPASPTWSR